MLPLTDFTEWLRRRHGAAHTSDARAAGWSAGLIASAVAAGVCIRVRRSWLVSPSCDPRRVAAVSVGGRVTCATAAELAGLWTTDHKGVHVAVPGNAARLDSAGLRLHWGTGPAPIARNAVDDHILNVLFHTARCLGRDAALPVWDSAVRKQKVELPYLRRVPWRSPDARALTAAVSALSDAGGETIFVNGMRAQGIVVQQQVWIDGHPVDGLIGQRLVVQIDGFEHHSDPKARRRDIEADARLTLMGYTVLRFDYQQLLFNWTYVRDTIAHAMAQDLHVAR